MTTPSLLPARQILPPSFAEAQPRAKAQRKIRTVVFSTLFPSAARPTHGVFVETRLRHLLLCGEVEARVVAPVPWFPSAAARWGSWGQLAATPAVENRNGIAVYHPRYLLPPKIGMLIAPLMLALGAYPTLTRLRHEGFDFDLIDAHYFYPDGVAAALLAGWLKKPFVVTARGSDIHSIFAQWVPRQMILAAAKRAYRSIGVCQALVDDLARKGADPSRLVVIRNGVDLARFTPLPRDDIRAKFKLPDAAPLLLSVGHLIELKGNHLTLAALQELPQAYLIVIGEGEERIKLEQLAARLGVAGRVRFVGVVPNVELAQWYSAADILVLASSREGWPNVLLESMACGTPVIATRTWGTPEVVSEPAAGRLIERRDAASIANAIRELFAALPPRTATRQYAERYSWEATTAAQLALFRDIVAAPV